MSTPAKKRRKIGPSTTYVAASNQLELLPDNALLLVMWYLDAVSLKRVGAVTRRLYRLSNDWSLWQDVDLSLVAKGQSNRKLQWIIHHVLKPTTFKLRIFAYKLNLNLTNSVLKLLLMKCPQINNLSFTGCSLKSLTWKDMVQFTTLKHLSIENCEFNGTNFFSNVNFDQFPKLTHLTFSGNMLFYVDVTKITSLTSLNLIGCTNIWNTALGNIADAKGLCHLSLPFSALLEPPGTSSNIQLCKLQSLVIGGNNGSRIPLQDIQVIAHLAPNLVFLDLSICDYRLSSDNSDKLVSLVTKLPDLKALGLVSQCMAEEELDHLSLLQPNLVMLTENWRLIAYKIRNKLPC